MTKLNSSLGYSFYCNDVLYVGQTGRSLMIRAIEHPKQNICYTGGPARCVKVLRRGMYLS